MHPQASPATAPYNRSISNPAISFWSDRVKMDAARQILIGASLRDRGRIGEAVDAPSGRSVSQEELEAAVLALSRLKEQLAQMYSTLNDLSTRNPGCEELKTWTRSFDEFVQGAGKTLQGEFSKRLLQYAHEFKNAESKPAQYESVKQLLRQLIRAMPLNKLLVEQRELLKQVLDLDKFGEERLVLTLDGGGVKGAVTLVVLQRLRDRLRQRTGIKDLRVEECFDLVVGTSTGGIITLSLCGMRMDIEPVLDLYKRFSGVVFSPENRTEWRYSMISKFGNKPLVDLMLEVVGLRRLDDPDMAFKDGSLLGPQGVRFGTTSVTLHTTDPTLILFRNYPKLMRDCCPAEAFRATGLIQGTNEALLIEAGLCTSAASTALHPYSRRYAPVEVSKNAGLASILGVLNSVVAPRTKYLERNKRIDQEVLMPATSTARHEGDSTRSNLYTYEQLFVDHCPPERRAAFAAKLQRDLFMNQGVTMSDGGSKACNPALVGMTEAQRLWGEIEGCGIRVVSIGTGELPVETVKTWDANRNPTPALLPLLDAEGGYREMITDLLMYSLVDAACETDETDAMMQRFGSLLAAYRRLNPPLPRTVRMDDGKPETFHELVAAATVWCDSAAGRELIETVSEEVAVNSTRLHARLQQRGS